MFMEEFASLVLNTIFFVFATHAELKENITKTIRNIPTEKYRNIIKGAYERPEKYVSKKNNTRKIKKNYL